MGLQCITTRWTNRVEYAAIVALTEVEPNHRFNFGHNRSCNISSTDGISNGVKESVDNSSHVKVTLELMWQYVALFPFNNKDSGFSPFFLQFLELAKNRISNFDVDDGF